MTWADIGEILKVAGAVATGIAACVGAYVAFRGLRKWQEETIGKRRAEVAEQVLSDFLQARKVFDAVRARGLRINEGASRSPPHETPELKQARDRYFVPIERLSQERELFRSLAKNRYIFEAYFGKDSAKPFELIDDVFHEIAVSAEILIQMASSNPSRQDREDEMPLRNSLGWGSRKRPDDIDRKLDDALKTIENVCRPVLAERVHSRS
jgi:hypothetical protein